MARTFRASVLSLLVVLAAACTGTGRNAPSPVDRATVRVTNQSWSDMTMYVFNSSGGGRQRLGLVNGNGRATFTIPSTLVGMGQSLRFMADPVGSSNIAQSFEIYVRPGVEVTLTIPARVR